MSADLLRDGYRLRWFLEGYNPDYTLSDLVQYVKFPPEKSAFMQTYAEEDSVWGLNEQLLAAIVDQLAILIWFKTKDGSKGVNRPAPIPRPGAAGDDGSEKIKGTPVSIEKMSSSLGITIF